MARFESIEDAVKFLEEAPPFDFLLSEPEASFLFAHNRYDKLTGAGTAASFIRVLGARHGD